MGKGSKSRPFSVDQKTFSDNWDNIFKKTKYAIKVVTEESFYYITEETDNCMDIVVELFDARDDAEEFANNIRASGCGGTLEVVEWLG